MKTRSFLSLIAAAFWGFAAPLHEARGPERPASIPRALCASFSQTLSLNGFKDNGLATNGPIAHGESQAPRLTQAPTGLFISAQLQDKISVIVARVDAEEVVPLVLEQRGGVAEVVPASLDTHPGRTSPILDAIAASQVAHDFLNSVELHRLQEMPWPDLTALLERMWDAKEQHLAVATELERKFLKGSIFNPAFVEAERNKPATIDFDLDSTLTRRDPSTGEYILRPGAENVLRELKARGLRLAVWTASASPDVRKFFLRHPQLIQYFDLVITGDNFLHGVMAEYADPEFAHAYQNADPARVRAFYSIDSPKDLSLLRNPDGRGHQLIVENNLQMETAAAKAPFGAFSVYSSPSFYADQPELQDMARLPHALLQRLAGKPVLPEGAMDVTVELAYTAQDIERLIPKSVTKDRLSKLKKAVKAHGPLKVFIYKDSKGGFFVALDLSDPGWMERLPRYPSERRALQRIRRYHADIQILIREDGKTPDLIVDGRLTEVKGASKGFNSQLREADKQLAAFGGRHALVGGNVALQLNNDDPVPVEDVLGRINRWAASNKDPSFERVWVYSNVDAAVFLRQPNGSFSARP